MGEHDVAGQRSGTGGGPERGAPSARTWPRRFEVLPEYRGRGVTLPRRQTPGSAGYDLAAAEDTIVPPGGTALVPTGLRAVFPPDEFLGVYVRSSVALRRGLALANGVGVIDADYARSANGGHILIAVRNLGTRPVRIARGERIAQGIFQRYAVADDDRPAGRARRGGFGSTGSAAGARTAGRPPARRPS
jgi:dUTP pyrophosphatase